MLIHDGGNEYTLVTKASQVSEGSFVCLGVPNPTVGYYVLAVTGPGDGYRYEDGDPVFHLLQCNTPEEIKGAAKFAYDLNEDVVRPYELEFTDRLQPYLTREGRYLQISIKELKLV
jgi:hypothetical protein